MRDPDEMGGQKAGVPVQGYVSITKQLATAKWVLCISLYLSYHARGDLSSGPRTAEWLGARYLHRISAASFWGL